MSTFSEKLKYLREKDGFPIEDFAKEIEVDLQKYIEYENGVTHPCCDDLQKIKSYFPSIEDIVAREDELNNEYKKRKADRLKAISEMHKPNEPQQKK